MNSFYSNEELIKIGFKNLGENVLISKKASIYGVQKITIGSNVRIDDFCILSGHITIGSCVHLSAYVSIFAGDTGVIIGDYCGVSSRSAIYAESDDYSGEYMTTPVIPLEYRNVIKGKVILEKFSLIGTGSTILPNTIIGEGTSTGAMSLISGNLEPWNIYLGIPAKKFKKRSKKIIDLEKEFSKSK